VKKVRDPGAKQIVADCIRETLRLHLAEMLDSAGIEFSSMYIYENGSLECEIRLTPTSGSNKAAVFIVKVSKPIN
jgi:hypothetical protein